MEKRDLLLIDDYLLTQHSYKEHLIFRLLMEFDIKNNDLLALKVQDLRGKRIFSYKGTSFVIGEELESKILFFTKFLKDDDYLFQGKNAEPISRSTVWRNFNKALQYFDFKYTFNVEQMRKVWKQKEEV